MIEINHQFLIEREDLNYPPHHTGMHLEEAFIKFWESNQTSNRKLIPVHWTAVYNYRHKEGFGPNTPNGTLRSNLKAYLKNLDPREKYFAVCTHDDAPTEELPPDTIVFAAGGNSKHINFPIPLTCGPHTQVSDDLRTIPISFVGSFTHPIRNAMAIALHGKPGVLISATEWQPKVPTERCDIFKQATQRSIFSLCPRGYGATSYRLYEAMQLGAIPVYISDRHMLPWSDEISWSEFSIIINPRQIAHLYEILMTIPGSKVRRMQENMIDKWEKYFSIDATCNNIIKRL